MALSNCAECGKVFAKIRSQICPACEREEEELLVQVKEFIRDEGAQNVLQIVDGTGVERERLLKWVDEGKLQLKNIEVAGPGCRKCGKVVDSGDICTACRRELASAIGDMRSKTGHVDGAATKRAGMHIRD